MLRGSSTSDVFRWGVALGLTALLCRGVGAEEVWNPAAALDRAISAAEERLQKGEFAAAESHYREALFEGWRLMGSLERRPS